MTKSLLETGKHRVTALTRPDSKSKLPDGVKIAKVDYNDKNSLVDALRGQDALIITMSVMAPPDQEDKLVEAAAEAGVSWILPNNWSPDTANEGLTRDVSIFQKHVKVEKHIEQLAKSSYIAVTTGFWYEWSLAIPAAYGFDFAKREVTFFDEGEVKISTSTWPQVGRAVAALLSLPEKDLEHFENKHAYVSSFTVSQKDMLDSALRVTGSKLEEWEITKEPATERYSKGVEAMKGGDRMGFAKMMYTRVFYDDGNGDFEKSRGLANELLGLPKEDLDEATAAAIKRSKEETWS